jgi:hypothetical protein
VDVFSEVGAGLTPVEEVEFSIKVPLGVEPISSGPYRMTLIELRELKKQWEELLREELIRLNISS